MSKTEIAFIKHIVDNTERAHYSKYIYIKRIKGGTVPDKRSMNTICKAMSLDPPLIVVLFDQRSRDI